MKNIVSFSGGKDSTALLLMMIDKEIPIDEIIFCDTGVEFSAMYDHINQVEKYINRKITVLKSDKDFEYLLLHHKKKSGNNKDLGYGFPRMMMNRWCTTLLKTQILNKYLKQNYNNEVNQFLGIAYDEKSRCKQHKYPLVEWGITEKMALDYCYNKGFYWNGLYEIFDRVSCWCCPMKSLKELKKLYSNFPELWGKLKYWESKSYNNFRCDYSLIQLERRFKLELAQISFTIDNMNDLVLA